MKKLILSTLILLLIPVAVLSAAATQKNHEIIGSWIFSVEQAPWEYSRGKIIFEFNENNEIAGRIEFETGRQLPIDAINHEGENLSFEANVDGYHVVTFMTIDGDLLTGRVQTVEGDMDLSARREISEG